MTTTLGDQPAIESTVTPVQDEQLTIELQHCKVQEGSDDHLLSAPQPTSSLLLASSNSTPVRQSLQGNSPPLKVIKAQHE